MTNTQALYEMNYGCKKLHGVVITALLTTVITINADVRNVDLFCGKAPCPNNDFKKLVSRFVNTCPETNSIILKGPCSKLVRSSMSVTSTLV